MYIYILAFYCKVPETISEDVGPQKKSQAEKIWATEVDSETPLTDFHQQVPHMAREVL